MDLVIDIGNTNTKTALFEETANEGNPEVTVIQGMPDAGFMNSLFENNRNISNCIISSVTRHLPARDIFPPSVKNLIFMNPAVPIPLKNRYSTPETLGNDRIAAAVGGNSLFPGQNVLVITAGTCITFDFVNSEGEYTGGSISPGMMMRFKALHTFTGKLPLIYPDRNVQLTGDSTESSIKSGVVEGITAEIEGITAKYRELYPDLKVVMSGGDLNFLDIRLKINIFAFPNIVIYGLHKILKFNVDHTS